MRAGSGTIQTRMVSGREEIKTVPFKDARFVPRGQTDTEEAINGSLRAIIPPGSVECTEVHVRSGMERAIALTEIADRSPN